MSTVNRLTPREAFVVILSALADMEHAAGLDNWDYDPLKEARETLWDFVNEHTSDDEPVNAIVWDTSQPWRYTFEE